MENNNHYGKLPKTTASLNYLNYFYNKVTHIQNILHPLLLITNVNMFSLSFRGSPETVSGTIGKPASHFGNLWIYDLVKIVLYQIFHPLCILPIYMINRAFPCHKTHKPKLFHTFFWHNCNWHFKYCGCRCGAHLSKCHRPCYTWNIMSRSRSSPPTHSLLYEPLPPSIAPRWLTINNSLHSFLDSMSAPVMSWPLCADGG